MHRERDAREGHVFRSGMRGRRGLRPVAARLAALAAAFGLVAAPWPVALAGSGPALTSIAPAFGTAQGGTQVEIDGSGFIGATGVLFGGQTAPFVVESNTLILAFSPPAPPGGGSVTVRVVTPAGTTPTSAADSFAYVGVPAVSGIFPQSGPVAGGTAVVVRGSGFSGATAVDFGPGRSANFSVVSDTEIEATLPADTTLAQEKRCLGSRCRTVFAPVPSGSALSVDVQVQTPAGSSATGAADRFEYLPTPSVTSVAPPTGPTTGGTAVTISGSGLTGAVSVTFGGVPAAFQVVSDSEIAATSPPGEGTVAVQVAEGPQVVSVAAGGDTAYAVLSDGSLWQWGLRAPLPSGTAGTPPACDCSSLPEAVSGLGAVSAVAVGTDSTYVLAADGSVWAWGAGGQGQLGDGRLVDSAVPVKVSGLSHVVAVAAGSAGGYALESDGTVWAWGSDIAGQLGSRAAWKRACLCSDVPVRVPGLSAIRGIAAGGLTGYAVTSAGAVWAWGGGSEGQLGDGSRRDIAPPEAVPGLAGIVQVAAGSASAYALGSDGTVWSWGADGHDELGATGVTPSAACGCVTAPAVVTGLPQIAVLAAGEDSAYALDTTGAVWAWGDGADGQLGAAVAASASATAVPGAAVVCACTISPERVPNLTDVTFLAAGGASVYTVGAGGVLQGWGDGSDGQLGPATQSGSNLAPVPLPFWSDASAVVPTAHFTYVTAAATAGSS